jgi:hypothetical protein
VDDGILNEFSASDGSDANNVIETSPEVDTERTSSSAVKDRIIEEVTERFPTHYHNRSRSMVMLSRGLKSVAILANQLKWRWHSTHAYFIVNINKWNRFDVKIRTT